MKIFIFKIFMFINITTALLKKERILYEIPEEI